MRRRRLLSPRRKSLIVALLALALLAFFAPRAWTGPLLTAVQFVIPAQYVVEQSVSTVENALPAKGPAIHPAEIDRMVLERRGLENVSAALAAKVADMQGEIDLLTAARLWTVDGLQLGAQGRLVPAKVLGGDLLGWRDSAWIDVGGTGSVKHGDAVVSRTLEIGAGTQGGVRDGLAVLLGESLVGLVEGVGTHSSRVKLLSDVGSSMKVRIGRMRDGKFVAADRYFWLAGAGKGEMRVGDVAKEDVEKGLVAVGDLVLSDPMLSVLPAPMVVGKVAAVGVDRENPLLSILSITSAVDLTNLRKVYVYDPRAGAASK